MKSVRRASPPTVRVLVADDDALFSEGLTLLLGTYGWIELVGRAEDGVEAVELASALLPDVVLMDLNMPRMDGIEATQIISKTLEEIRVVLLTASTSPLDAVRAAAAGASAYLTKGCSSDELVTTLEPAADWAPFALAC
jgi:DNA-binding NarL/FixJ family response regulator